MQLHIQMLGRLFFKYYVMQTCRRMFRYTAANFVNILWFTYAAAYLKHATARSNCKLTSKCPLATVAICIS